MRYIYTFGALCALMLSACSEPPAVSTTANNEAQAEQQKASTEIFADIVTALKDLCQGVHIITIGGEEKLKYYLDAAKLK